MPKRIVAPALLFMFVTLACIVSAAALSCSGVDCKDPKNAGSAGCVIEKAVVDCTGGDVTAAVAKYGPVVTDIVKSAPRKTDGSIDWGSIASKIEQAAKDYGVCVVASVFSHYVLGKVTAEQGSGAINKDDAKAGFDQLRNQLWPGKTFKTPDGTL